GIGVRCARGAAVQPNEAYGRGAAREADALGDLGDGAHLGVLAFVARYEEDAVVVADLCRDRDVHVREDDGVVERDQKKGAQTIIRLSSSVCLIEELQRMKWQRPFP